MKKGIIFTTLIAVVLMAFTIAPSKVSAAGGDGLTAQYFQGQNFETPKLTRVDKQINFDFAAESPDPTISNDEFTIRWQGFIKPDKAGEYTFTFLHNDGAKVWIDDNLVYDLWQPGQVEGTFKVKLEADKYHSLKIEAFEGVGSSRFKLSWEAAGVSKDLVPTANLFTKTASATAPATNPKTGDTNSINLYIALALSSFGIAAFIIRKKAVSSK